MERDVNGRGCIGGTCHLDRYSRRQVGDRFLRQYPSTSACKTTRRHTSRDCKLYIYHHANLKFRTSFLSSSFRIVKHLLLLLLLLLISILNEFYPTLLQVLLRCTSSLRGIFLFRLSWYLKFHGKKQDSNEQDNSNSFLKAMY